ncbi:MAG: oxidoreductase [Chloroflexi bacterium]|nr:oxidoreductase [Chloroflexota bacterium]
MAKLKLASYWAASCGGCDIAVLDSNEKVLGMLADTVLWPFALDFKYRHLEALPDQSIEVALFSGAIRTSEQWHHARLLRDKARILVAFGSCACFGGVPALANLHCREEVFQRLYWETPSTANPWATFPQTRTPVAGGELDLPEFYDTVLTLDQVVPVDCSAPGCPPPPESVLRILEMLETGAFFPPGSVLASDKSLCDECQRVRQEKKITRLYRVHEIMPDPQTCLLEQGLICLGPATRGGCGLRCLKANMPCRGCFGPLPGVIDQGAKMLSALTSIYEAKEDDDLARLLTEVADPAGSFYRFGMSRSLLQRRRLEPMEAAAR